MNLLYKRGGKYLWACGCGFINQLRCSVIAAAATRHAVSHLYPPTLAYRNGRYDVRPVARVASAERIFASMP